MTPWFNRASVIMDWDDSHDQLCSAIAEESQVNSYLHRKAFEYFERKNMLFQMPIIILSVLSGSANFISSSFPEVQKHIVLGVGGLSIGISIISSIAQFLKLSESSEAHRMSYMSWEKLYSRLTIQLRMKRKDRAEPVEFITGVENDYLRLLEMSPDLPPKICSEAKARNRKTLTGLVSPVVVSGFRRVVPYGATELDMDQAFFPPRPVTGDSAPVTPSIRSSSDV